jgi:hypothetical protein
LCHADRAPRFIIFEVLDTTLRNTVCPVRQLLQFMKNIGYRITDCNVPSSTQHSADRVLRAPELVVDAHRALPPNLLMQFVGRINTGVGRKPLPSECATGGHVYQR